MDKDFITVAEFAAGAGVSRQAIYKRLSTDLQPYVQRLNGILCISKEALKILDLTYHSTKLSTSCQPSCQPLNGGKLPSNGDLKQVDLTHHSTRLSTDSTKVVNQAVNQVDNPVNLVDNQPKQITQLELLKTTIEMLQTQLEREHKEKLELLELLRTTQNNLQAAQVLHGGTIQKMLDKPMSTDPPVKEQTVNVDAQAVNSDPLQSSETATPKRPAPTVRPKHPRSTKKPAPRTTFWNRLIGKA